MHSWRLFFGENNNKGIIVASSLTKSEPVYV
jgi:hypothetical protein